MINIKGMCTLVIILWVLCVGVVNIVTGQEPEVEKLGHNKLNFGYGINFKYNGEVHNNLDRVWVVKRFNLPKELHLSFRGLKYGLDCEYENIHKQLDALKEKHGSIPAEKSKRLDFMKEVCRQTKPMLNAMSVGAIQYQKVIEKLVNQDLHHALHSLSVVDEIRYRRYAIANENKFNHTSHKPNLRHVNFKTANDSTTGRTKRGIFAFLPVLGKVATIAVEALGSYLQNKRNKAIAKALEAIQSGRFLERNHLYNLEKDFVMYGEYEVQSTDGLIKLLSNLNNRTVSLENMLNGKFKQVTDRYLENYRGTEIYTHQVSMYVQAMTERYIRVPENLIHELRLLLRSIATLSKGYLPPQLFTPTDIVKISEDALKLVQKRHPDYVLAIPQASSYYDMRLVTFGIDERDRMVVCFPIFVKDFSREPMTLYQIETVPVPIVDENLKANSYSQAIINKPYIATNDDYYIQLVMEELFMCKQIKQIYFCEELFLVKHKTKHSCESALFYELGNELIKQNCEFKYFYNTSVIPSILDGGSHIVLANMLSEKRLICSYDQGLAKPLPTSPYVLAERKILCHCHIQSGLTYVLKNIASCNATDRPQLQYTANLAFLTYFDSFLNETEQLGETLSEERILPIAMEDYSEDPDFSTYCQDTSIFPDTLAKLAHVHFQKQMFLQHKSEFPSEGKAGIDVIYNEKSVTPSSSGNSFSFLFTIAFHIFVFLGSCLSLIMLLPQLYMIIKHKKIKGLVAAITLYNQATEATASPVNDTHTKVICHDPWVSIVLTLLTVLGMAAYIYKHGRNLALIHGYKFTNVCEIYILICSQTHFVKIKVAAICSNPNHFKQTKIMTIEQITLQRGYIWDYIHITWGDVKILNSSLPVQVRQHICVPLIDRFRVRKLLPKSREVTLMVQQGDTWVNINSMN